MGANIQSDGDGIRLSGKGIYLLSILVVVHWTAMIVLIDMGQIAASQFRLVAAPAPIIIGLLSFVYTYGTTRGFVEPLPAGTDQRYIASIIAAIVISGAITVSILFI